MSTKRFSSILLAIAIIASIVSMAVPAMAADSGLKAVYDIKQDFADKTNAETVTYGDTNGFWEYYGKGSTWGSISIRTAYGFQASIGANWFAIKIKVPAAGDYNVSLEHGQASSGCVGSVYILPGDTADVKAAIAEKTGYIGEADYYFSGSLKTVTTVLTENKFSAASAGEYIVVFNYSKQSASGGTGKYMYPGKVTLDGGEGTTEFGMKLDLNKTELQLNAARLTANATGKVLMCDGTESAATVSYSSANNAVATVDSNGVVTAHSVGAADITATWTDGERTLANTKTIMVKDTALSGLTVKYDVASLTNQYKASTPAENPPNKTSPSVAFTYENSNGFWKYLYNSGKLTDGSSSNFKYLSLGIQFAKSWFVVLEIYVPAAGLYNLESWCGWLDTGCANMEIYLLPQDFTTTSYVASTWKPYLIGTVDCSNGPQNYFTAKSSADYVGAVAVETAGYYKLAYRSSADGYANAGTIVFNGGDGAAFMGSMNVGKENLTRDEMTTVSVNGLNGLATPYISNTTEAASIITYASSDDSVASVEPSIGIIMAKSLGEAIISATASGITIPLTKKVTVADVTAPSEVSLYVTTEGADAEISGIENKDILYNENIGTPIVLTAGDVSGYKFKYWANRSGTPVSSEKTYRFTAITTTFLKAVYEENSQDDEKANVNFYNANGKLLKMMSVVKGTLFKDIENKPETRIPGYGAASWNISDEAPITGETNVAARFKERGDSVANVKIGSDVQSDTCVGDEIKRTAPATDSDNKVFSHWTRDGKIVSFDSEYKFYVWGATDIVPVYADTAARAVPTVMLDTKKVDDAYMIEYNVPTGYTKVEAGIIFNSNAAPVFDVNHFYSKAVAKAEDNHGQFSALPSGVDPTKETAVMGYLIYKDSQNNYKVVYSEVIAE